MMLDDALLNQFLEFGANKVFVIDVDAIEFDEGLRSYCEVNYCGNYNQNHACPPSVGDVKDLIGQAKGYNKALVFQSVSKLEDSFDFEGMEAAALRHAAIAKKINQEIKTRYDDYLQLAAGKCTVCPVCAKVEDQPCRFPQEAIASLEAYCINVSTLADHCQMNYINGKDTVTYFGAFLF